MGGGEKEGGKRRGKETGSNKEGTGTEPEPEIIMGPIHIFKQYLTYFL